MIKNKTNSNKKNKYQIWYKIKWTKILRDAIEKKNQLREWYKIIGDAIEKII
jgi:hypothetical protein